MIKKTFPIIGMHCASCKALIEGSVINQKGVKSVNVNFATEKMHIEYDPELVTIREIKSAVSKVGSYELIYDEENEEDLLASTPEASKIKNHKKTEKRQKEVSRKLKKNLIITAVGGGLFFLAMIWMLTSRFSNNIPTLTNFFGSLSIEVNSSKTNLHIWYLIQFLISTPILFIGGKTFFKSAFKALKAGKANMDTLISIGTLTAWIFSTAVTFFPNIFTAVEDNPEVYFEATTFIIFFILLGRYLESKSKKEANNAIQKLIELQPNQATVIKNGKEEKVPLEEVEKRNIILVKPGEKIPVDGVVVEGESTVNEAMITGESMPIDKSPGDQVIGGTINKNRVFKFRAEAVGSETMLAQIIQMVEESQTNKAPIQKLTDKISAIFVPVVIVIALFAFIFWSLIAPDIGVVRNSSEALQLATYISTTILIIACPCALGLATPVAITVATGNAAQKGILLKEADALQTISKVNIFIFDKTGTLTQGNPKVVNLYTTELKKDELIKIAASAEQLSEHPIGKAILSYAEEKKLNLYNVKEFEAIPGKGLKAKVKKKNVLIGNIKLFDEEKISYSKYVKKLNVLSKEGKTPMLVAIENQLKGIIAVADPLKNESKKLIEKLNKKGIKTVMLTGDNNKTAKYIADKLNIDEFYAEVLPQDKAKIVKNLKNSNSVAVIGDGINDAPALTEASVGIAMGTGTDIAIESADIILIKGNLNRLEQLLNLSSRTIKIIRQNLLWAFLYNSLGIPIAAGILYPFGILLSPIFGSIAMALSSVSVVLNSLRIRKE